MLLLGGPPGVGKTTLARILAALRKYRTAECNCSELRTGQMMENKVPLRLFRAIAAINTKKNFSECTCVFVSVSSILALCVNDISMVWACVSMTIQRWWW